MSQEILETHKDEHPEHHHGRILVIVSYAPAVKPFKAEEEPAATVGQIKQAVLNAFGLKETDTKKFKLFHGKTELTNEAETVHQLAGHHKELHLKLEEFLVQG
jgi:hypothetical protein